jgi:L-ribulokinase
LPFLRDKTFYRIEKKGWKKENRPLFRFFLLGEQMKRYALGLDFGTNSVRALLVDVNDGKEIATSIFDYQRGQDGIILDPDNPHLARQHPQDYLSGLEVSVKGSLEEAKNARKNFEPGQVIGIGIDTTGSTPLPVDGEGIPLCFKDQFKSNPNAHAWLWKDHTSTMESALITELAAREHPEYLAKCGGTYSSEWFFSKIFHCLRTDPEVFEAAFSWVECCDYIPAVITGTDRPGQIKRSRCAAGHKAMYSEQWDGLPAREFLAKLDPRLGELRERLYERSYTSDRMAGTLTPEWAEKLGLRPGLPVAVGAFDAHLGAVGAGVAPGKLVKIIGTSTCDIAVWPGEMSLADIPGVCGIVDGSVLPGYYGIEAGQSAVGDIFNWFVNYLQPGGAEKGSHQALTRAAEKIRPGQSGLLALDWNNGNRTILVDQRLTGLLVGQTLHTRAEEIYRALIEATAFGALTIINRFEKYGVKISEVINCGGIAEKNPLIMQVYADALGREMKLARSAQTCALGAAIAGAVVAGKEAGGYTDFPQAQSVMCGIKNTSFSPDPEHHKVYRELYRIYSQLHDAFGRKGSPGGLYNVMKDLLQIREGQIRGQ